MLVGSGIRDGRGVALSCALAGLLMALVGCRTMGGASEGARVLDNTNWENSSSWDSPACAARRERPMVALGMHRRVSVGGCDPNMDAFRDKINASFRGGAVRWGEFDVYIPAKRENEIGVFQYIIEVVQEAVRATPGCPMVAFNIECFDPDVSWKGKLGIPRDTELGWAGVTAYEIESILCDPTLAASTLWFRSGRLMRADEVQNVFARYFPARCFDLIPSGRALRGHR